MSEWVLGLGGLVWLVLLLMTLPHTHTHERNQCQGMDVFAFGAKVSLQAHKEPQEL